MLLDKNSINASTFFLPANWLITCLWIDFSINSCKTHNYLTQFLYKYFLLYYLLSLLVCRYLKLSERVFIKKNTLKLKPYFFKNMFNFSKNNILFVVVGATSCNKHIVCCSVAMLIALLSRLQWNKIYMSIA